jgi:hypothetical protein
MDKDASQMTDEELDQMIESGSTLEVSPSEPTTEEEVVVEDVQEEQEEVETPTEEVEAEPVEETAQEEAPQPVSNRENLRIQKLIERMKQQPAQPEPVQATGIDYGTALDADPEVIQQLEADRQAASQTAYNQGLEQAKSIQFHTRLELDAPKVEGKYAVLNPEDKENFNPALANAVNTWYLSSVGYDASTGAVATPDIRYADFVEGIMELGEVIGAKKAVVAAKNVAKQARSTGLRPDGSSAKRLDLNKAPGQMSDEELDAFLANAGVPSGNK